MSFSVAASIGNMPFASGAGGNGPHLCYASNNAQWWVFWLSSTNVLNAKYWNGSAWTTPSSGATFTLPAAHGSEGRRLTVVGVTISTHDVAWFGYNDGSGNTYAWRAQLNSGSVAWGTASTANNDVWSTAPEGTGIGLDSSGVPYILFENFGDTHGQKATNADTGTGWTSGWGSDTTFVSANQTASRQVVPGSGGYLLFLSGNAGNSSLPWDTNIVANYSNAVPTTSVSVFASSSNTYPGDFCGVQADGSNYIVARRNATALEARLGTVVSNAISSWTALPTVPTTGLALPATQSGVALISDGTSKVYLFVIDSGTGNPVKYCTFTKGASWSSGSWGTWTTLESSSQTRNSISACPSVNGSAAWVLWTETVSAGSQYSVVSGQLSLSSAHNLATAQRSTFLIRAAATAKTRPTFQTRTTLAGHTRDTFSVRAGLAAHARDTFRVFLALRTNGRDTFPIRAALASRTRATFATRVSALASRLRSTFPVRAGLAARLRDTFKIGVGGLHDISTWGRAKFVSRAGQRTNARSTFASRVAVLTSRARDTFAVRVRLAAHPRATLVVRLALATRLRETFVNRAWLIGNTRAAFALRTRAFTRARSQFANRTTLRDGARATFKLAIGTTLRLRDTFKVNGTVVVLPFRAAYVSAKQKLSATFTTTPRLSAARLSTTAKLSATFTRSPSLVNPNSTIQVKMQATDISGAHPANLSAVSVVVTFPDGTQSTYTMAAGQVTNNLDGTYTLTYTTKGLGLNQELWSFVAANGTDTDTELNITPVSY